MLQRLRARYIMLDFAIEFAPAFVILAIGALYLFGVIAVLSGWGTK